MEGKQKACRNDHCHFVRSINASSGCFPPDSVSTFPWNEFIFQRDRLSFVRTRWYYSSSPANWKIELQAKTRSGPKLLLETTRREISKKLSVFAVGYLIVPETNRGEQFWMWCVHWDCWNSLIPFPNTRGRSRSDMEMDYRARNGDSRIKWSRSGQADTNGVPWVWSVSEEGERKSV